MKITRTERTTAIDRELPQCIKLWPETQEVSVICRGQEAARVRLTDQQWDTVDLILAAAIKGSETVDDAVAVAAVDLPCNRKIEVDNGPVMTGGVVEKPQP